MITITRLAAALLLAAAAQNSAWAAMPETFSNDIKEYNFGSFTTDIQEAEADFGLLPEALRPTGHAPLAVAASAGAGPVPVPVPEPSVYVLLLLGAGLTLLKSRRPEQSAPWSLQL